MPPLATHTLLPAWGMPYLACNLRSAPPPLAQMREGIQEVAARLKAHGKAEAAAAERPRNSRRRAGTAAEDHAEEPPPAEVAAMEAMEE